MHDIIVFAMRSSSLVRELEALLPPDELVSVGGPIRKDVAGYDLKSL